MRRMEEARRAVALGAAVVMSLVPAVALAQVQTAPPAYPVPQQQYAPPAVPVAPAEEAPPPEAQWTVPQDTGRWVYTSDHGWVFVPNGAAS